MVISTTAWMYGALLLQGTLTLALLGWLSYVRVRLLKAGKVRASDVVLSREPWPDEAKQASNAFDNQFQLPVLLFLAVPLSLHLGPNWLEIVLVWVFAVSRWAHAAVYITTNYVPYRATAFSIGYAALIVIWADLVVRVAEAVSRHAI